MDEEKSNEDVSCIYVVSNWKDYEHMVFILIDIDNIYACFKYSQII